MMQLTFLGTGTSTGVPQVGCDCEVCRSVDPRDNRLRASALLRTEGGNILIDCGPDFREQMLRAGAPKIDAVLITHSHYDHVGGPRTTEQIRMFFLIFSSLSGTPISRGIFSLILNSAASIRLSTM